MSPAQRLVQSALIVCGIALCWLTMQAVHELGHVLGALASGGTVQQVVLRPLTISRTDVQPNPNPALVVWAGPIVGVLLPSLIWWLVRCWRPTFAYLVRWWCGFCLVVNGAYIGSGVIAPVGDARTMLQTGSPSWLLLLFGVMVVPAGLWCWHNQGRDFGLGPQPEPVNQRHTCGVICLLIAIVVAEIALA